MQSSYNPGFAIIELLVALVIIAILASLALIALRPDPTLQLAREVTALHQQARYQSINTSTLILSTWDTQTNAWQISQANPSNPCTAEAILQTSTSYKNITANTRGFAGIVWQPNGLAATCSGPGQPVAQQRVILNSGSRSTTITFDSTGRGQHQ